MQRRPSQTKATDQQIKAWLIKNWQNQWWGFMDCDRCILRKNAPCDTCSRWPYLIRDYRRGDLTVRMGRFS